MNPLVRKEVRMALPSLIPMAALMLAAVWIFPSPDQALAAFGIAAVFIALAPFGQEFSLGTFSSLLSQPLARERMWILKVIVTATAVASLALVFVAAALLRGWLETRVIEFSVPVAMVALIALAGALWTTVLFRQTAMAFVFTILAPLFIVTAWATILSIALDGRYIPGTDLLYEFTPYFLLALYSATAILWSRRRFLGAEDTGVLGQRLSFPTWRIAPDRVSATRRTAGPAPLRALLSKEVLSHQMAFVIAGALACVQMGLFVLGKFAPVSEVSYVALLFPMLLDLSRFLWVFLPLIIGGAAIADERKDGTLESQLCLPTARWRQFGLKLLVAILLSVLLGSIMPGAIEGVGSWTGIAEQSIMCRVPMLAAWSVFSCHVAAPPQSEFIDYRIVNWEQEFIHGALFSAAIAAAAALVSFLASSLTRNSLEALGAAFIAVPSLGMLFLWTFKETLITTREFSLWKGPLVFAIGLPAVAAAILGLSFLNYPLRRPGRVAWIRSIGVLGITLAASGLAAAVIYPRPWERWTKPEPRHTSARLDGHIAPTICSTAGRIVVLLPDGRLWVSTQMRLRKTVENTWDLWNLHPPIPEAGELIPGNWQSVSCLEIGTEGNAVALRQNGRFERISWETSASPKLERIGPKSDWKGVFSEPYSLVFWTVGANGELWEGNYRQGDLHRFLDLNGRHLEHLKEKDPHREVRLWSLPIKNDPEIQTPFSGLYPSKSRYSDWIVSNGNWDLVALAADGTICGWTASLSESGMIMYVGGFSHRVKAAPLLAPSNRPTWCLNVLAGERRAP